MNRNFSVGSVFDGYSGASATNCTGGTFAGPTELSEPEARNEVWLIDAVPEHQVRDEHALLRRVLHVASGRVQGRGPRDCCRGSTSAPRQYFWDASDHILSAVQD